jgi:hypothetical protein
MAKPRRQIIQHDHGLLPVDQVLHNMTANIARAARHQNRHARTLDLTGPAARLIDPPYQFTIVRSAAFTILPKFPSYRSPGDSGVTRALPVGAEMKRAT